MPLPTERILLVDDDVPFLVELSEGLHALGFAVRACSSAAEALGRIATQPEIAVVVTDVLMPEMDGMRFVRELCHRSGPPAVIVMTAHATLDLAVAAMRCKVVDLLHKPVTAEEVAAAIERVMACPADPACRAGRGEPPGTQRDASPHLPGLELLIGQIEDRNAAFGAQHFRDERWDLLLRLAAAPPGRPVRLRDLAQATLSPTRSVRRTLVELAALGLVEEGQDTDRRRRAFQLTAAARQRMERLLARLPRR